MTEHGRSPASEAGAIAEALAEVLVERGLVVERTARPASRAQEVSQVARLRGRRPARIYKRPRGAQAAYPSVRARVTGITAAPHARWEPIERPGGEPACGGRSATWARIDTESASGPAVLEPMQGAPA
jgi:hypothetical protein